MKTALVWDPSFGHYRFRADHPFNPKRLELTISLIETLGLVGDGDNRLVAPRIATDEEILRVHDPEFVRAVKRVSRDDASEQDGCEWGLGSLDTPIFPGMHDAAAAVVGGTLKAAEMVMAGEVTRAFAIAGGLHHAHRNRAAGFCVYNDLAIAIDWVRSNYGARVMYIDYDAHHGDGVQEIFYDNPEVLTFSIHESGRYLFPSTGFVDELGEGDGYGYSLNLPMDPQTEDDSWLYCYREILEEAADAFRPDVIVLQNGCDAHLLDPLSHLRGSTRLVEETVRITNSVADKHCGGRIIATGGGGYAIWRVVPRAWTLVWAGLTEQGAANAIPYSWLERWQGESPYLLPPLLRDEQDSVRAAPRKRDVEAVNRQTMEDLRRRAMPLLRGWGMEF
ncbi:MAG TPA: acetoin utilization protein AcuC [Longimicrobiaceae bacterium]|nr:acetoin utilization protein AcuC [Longimicrobiaceae bacterium]